MGATRRFIASCSRREARAFPSLLLLVRPTGNPLKAGSHSAAPCRLTTVMRLSIQVQAAQCATNPAMFLQTRCARGFSLPPPVWPSPIRAQPAHLHGLANSTRKAAAATMASFAGGNERFWRLSLDIDRIGKCSAPERIGAGVAPNACRAESLVRWSFARGGRGARVPCL